MKDIRYEANGKGDEKFLSWQDLLNLLEGATVKIQAPKTYYTENLEWVQKQPIVATSCAPITRVMANQYDKIESEQMNARWNMIHFAHLIPSDKIDYTLVPCGRCIAHLILGGSDLQEL